MYAWIFRHLPGPLWMRIILTLALLAAAVLLLMEVVFPWVDQYSPLNDSTIQDG
ncbi:MULTISPECIES: hypothetical protein [Nesterenkonia]|uniref:Uncharacterized protein n=1 Tax=Nesterenkonia xinjiangensis TaxID=225327 RepID=A0A7Z0K8V9_9MICC|nr:MULTISPECIES: hypothetical protein [Nesterenkonia]MDZ5077403.1 hypothetical protein [Nesterenkonia sp. HG001]NYJ78036.1 hypothetical protein [Nesterenkonia xinjiangensis]